MFQGLKRKSCQTHSGMASGEGNIHRNLGFAELDSLLKSDAALLVTGSSEKGHM